MIKFETFIFIFRINNKIINKVEVIFEDAEPILKSENETV